MDGSLHEVCRLLQQISGTADYSRQSVFAVSLVSMSHGQDVVIEKVLPLLSKCFTNDISPETKRCLLTFACIVTERQAVTVADVPPFLDNLLSLPSAPAPADELVLAEVFRLLSLCEVTHRFIDLFLENQHHFSLFMDHALINSYAPSLDHFRASLFELLNILSEECPQPLEQWLTGALHRMKPCETSSMSALAYLQVGLNLINSSVAGATLDADVLFRFVESGLGLRTSWFVAQDYAKLEPMIVDSESDSFNSDEETAIASVQPAPSQLPTFSSRKLAELLDCLVVCAKLFETSAFARCKESLGQERVWRLAHYLIETAQQDEQLLGFLLSPSTDSKAFDGHCEVTYRALCALTNFVSAAPPLEEFCSLLRGFAFDLLLQVLMLRGLPGSCGRDYPPSCKTAAVKILLLLHESHSFPTLGTDEWVQLANALQVELRSNPEEEFVPSLCALLAATFAESHLSANDQMCLTLSGLQKSLLQVVVRKHGLTVVCAALDLMFVVFADKHYNQVFDQHKTLNILMRVEPQLSLAARKVQASPEEREGHLEACENLRRFIAYKAREELI